MLSVEFQALRPSREYNTAKLKLSPPIFLESNLEHAKYEEIKREICIIIALENIMIYYAECFLTLKVETLVLHYLDGLATEPELPGHVAQCVLLLLLQSKPGVDSVLQIRVLF